MSVPSFATGTSVAVSKTVGDIEALVEQYGATGFAWGKDSARGLSRVMFTLAGRPVVFTVEHPKAHQAPARQPNQHSAGRPQGQAWVDAELRRRWRCIYLLAKALCVAVEDGILDARTAFLPYTLLPDGQTVGEWAEVQQAVWTERTMPSLLPGARAAIQA